MSEPNKLRAEYQCEYQCAVCSQVFEPDRTEEEAVAEKEEYFPGVPIEACEIVCDPCWQIIRPQ